MIPARSVLPAAVLGQAHERLAVVRLHQRLSELVELLGSDETSQEGGCLRAADEATRATFELSRVDRRIEQRVRRSGVEPARPLGECLHAEAPFVQVDLVDCRDLQFTSSARGDALRDLHDRRVVEVHAWHGEVRLRLLGLLLDRDGGAVLVEFDHSVVLGVVDLQGEDRRAVGLEAGLHLLVELCTVEEVISEGQRDVVVADEASGDQEALRDPAGYSLNAVRQIDAECVSVSQHHAELLDVVGCGDDLDVVDAGLDEVGERVVDRGLSVDRSGWFAHAYSIGADALGNRTEASTFASGQNECLQGSSWV